MNGDSQSTFSSRPLIGVPTSVAPSKSHRLHVICTNHESAMRITETLTRTNGVRSVSFLIDEDLPHGLTRQTA